MKYFFILALLLALNNNSFAIEKSQRESLKQEILSDLLQSDTLKKLVIKEIKLYEIEKQPLKQNKRQQQKNTISRKAKKILRPVSAATDHIYGNPNAPISVIEFSDFKCPYCRKIHPVLKRLINESNQQVNWVFRHYPLSFHKPNAELEAEAAECIAHLAGNKSFWVFIDTLFSQPRRGQKDSNLLINRAASKVNIDQKPFENCKKTRQFSKKVAADEKEALTIGLRGTPANIIVHHKSKEIIIRQGSATLQTFKKDIKSLLKPIRTSRERERERERERRDLNKVIY